MILTHWIKLTIIFNPIWRVCLLFIMFGCATPSHMMQSTCNFIPSDKTPPNWVLGDNHLKGYYVGIGRKKI